MRSGAGRVGSGFALLGRRPVGWASLFVAAACLSTARAQSAAPPVLGVYLGNGATGVARLPAFSTWLGREPDRVLDFFAYDSWSSLESDALWTCESWRGKGRHPVVPALTVSLPLTIPGTTLAEVAAGRHDGSFLAVARGMVANGWGASIVRLGWEFNGTWMPWAAGKDPASYREAYRHVVKVMRSLSGANFKFDWCCACGRNEIDPDSVYPGDDVVDIVGMDVYTRYYSPYNADPRHRWQTLRTVGYGIDWLVDFSVAHRKELSIPEWGTGEALTRDGGVGGGDDPLFVENMARFLRDNHAVYSDYWDYHAPDYNASVSDGEHPLAGMTLRQLFGAVQARIQPNGAGARVGPDHERALASGDPAPFAR
jgi:Glycosyl hydrolase family 26